MARFSPRRIRIRVQRSALAARERLALATRPRTDTPKLLIFAQGRSGSTLLESLIVSSGEVVGLGEALSGVAVKVRRPGAYLRGMGRRLAPRPVVAHVKPYHLDLDRRRVGAAPVELRSFLQEMAAEGWRILWLRRLDAVSQHISRRIVDERGGFHKREGRDEQFAITLDRDDLFQAVATRTDYLRREEEALAGIEHLPIVYERDLLDATQHQATLDRVLAFAGLPAAEVSTDLRKINTRPLRESVTNYDDLVAWGRELGWTDPTA